MLTGDAELESEAEILEAGIDLNADILKAGHHGSRTSSSWDFLEAVSPSLILISAGIDNSYGHPHEETLEKAADLGIEIRRTDLEGRLSLNPLDFCTQAT
ncbi:MAG: competence protein ComEC [Oceanicoccus sp.]